MDREHFRHHACAVWHVEVGDVFERQIHGGVNRTGFAQGRRRGLQRLAELLAGEGGLRAQSDQEYAGGRRPRRQGQQQGVAQLAGKIAAVVQIGDHSAGLRVDETRPRPHIALLIDADDGAVRCLARLDIDNCLEFHIKDSLSAAATNVHTVCSRGK